MIKSPTPKTTLPEYDRQLLQGVPFLNGKELLLETATTFAEQKLPHGLGRTYRGGWQVATGNTYSVLFVLDPADQDDADVNVTFIDAVGTAGTTKIWVY